MKAEEKKTKCGGCGQMVLPNEYHPYECCVSFKAGLEQGHREVAEWITKYQWTEQGLDWYRFEQNGEWQAKLKEWGIDEKG